mmetsp:Transcript_8861/g.24048  ORF Transcript_8861/g.24048 Transcript_8861/m.24048 type:complete len:149 (+) Transcript_8861:178-624(+)
MASLEDLTSLLKKALDEKGSLGEIRARIRSEVFQVLEGDVPGRPAPAPETTLLIELIRDFLDFHGYKHTSQVLLSESGHSKEKLDSDLLAHEAFRGKVVRDSDMPVLYSMLEYTRSARREEEKSDSSERSQERRVASKNEPSAIIFNP